MMITIALALAAAPSAGATPCELRGVPAVELVALKVAILDQAQNGTAKPAAADTTLRAIEGKAAACNPGNDPASDRSAVEVATARLTADTVAEKLAADGVDMRKVDAQIRRTDKPILQALVARRMDAEGVDNLRERVVAVAGDAPSDAMQRLLGFYAFNTARVMQGVSAPTAARSPASTPKRRAPVER